MDIDTDAKRSIVTVRGASRVIAVFAIVAGSFALALTLRIGGIDELLTRTPVVDAGGFHFVYPKGWKRMPSAKVPADAKTSVRGHVVAGLCPGASSKAHCSVSVDMSYVIFQQSEILPNLDTLQAAFEQSFPRSYTSYRKLSGDEYRTVDGTAYLRYEFSFRDGSEQRQGIVAAYRARSKGVIVVASGPTGQFRKHRTEILRVLDDARDIGTEAG